MKPDGSEPAYHDYFCPMDLRKYFDIAEDAIRTIGVDPETTRCAGEGQWLLERGEIEIYVDIWQPKDHHQWEYFREDEPSAMFQVVSPVCYIPKDQSLTKAFYEELLYINHHMFYGAFTVNPEEKMAAIVHKRLVEGLNRVEMIEPIEAIGYYAENLREFLSAKYDLKKIEKIN
ncbi:MAG: hypothetical protein GC181_15725 [Bacteroidetes bacterium]|nr:hypothetical protein [Bacteroidota bacterium]